MHARTDFDMGGNPEVACRQYQSVPPQRSLKSGVVDCAKMEVLRWASRQRLPGRFSSHLGDHVDMAGFSS